MSLEKQIKEKEIASVVLQIDKLKEEKKHAANDYKKQIDALQKQLLANANEIDAGQLSLDLD